MGKKNDGLIYQHNYDFVGKWMSKTFRNKTLDIIGVKTQPIKRVVGYEAPKLDVKIGRVDVIFEDIAEECYHVEWQRNLKKADLYRCASYHFEIAPEYDDNLTDILLISGEPQTNRRKIKTKSGTYEPIIIDFGAKNAEERFKEIQKEVEAGNYDSLLELVFIPLYGKAEDKEREIFVKEVITYERDLWKQGKMSENLVVATMIMSNKFVDKDFLVNLLEEMDMFNILDAVKEKYIEEAMLEKSRKVVETALNEAFGFVPPHVIDKIKSISHESVLDDLHRQAIRSKELSKFENILNQAVAVS